MLALLEQVLSSGDALRSTGQSRLTPSRLAAVSDNGPSPGAIGFPSPTARCL